MGKVNLRNRFRENPDDANPSNGNDLLEQDAIPVSNSGITQVNEASTINNRLNNVNQPRPEPTPESQSADIFKNEAAEDKKLKSLFGGKKEQVGAKNNLLDKLNVNKKMFYIAIGFAGFASFLVITYLTSLQAEKIFGSEMGKVVAAKKFIS